MLLISNIFTVAVIVIMIISNNTNGNYAILPVSAQTLGNSNKTDTINNTQQTTTNQNIEDNKNNVIKKQLDNANSDLAQGTTAFKNGSSQSAIQSLQKASDELSIALDFMSTNQTNPLSTASPVAAGTSNQTQLVGAPPPSLQGNETTTGTAPSPEQPTPPPTTCPDGSQPDPDGNCPIP